MSTLDSKKSYSDGKYCFSKGAMVIGPFVLMISICFFIFLIPIEEFGQLPFALLFKALSLLMFTYLTWLFYNIAKEIQIDSQGLHIRRFSSFSIITWNKIRDVKLTRLPTTGFTLLRIDTRSLATNLRIGRIFVWPIPGSEVELKKLNQLMSEIKNFIDTGNNC